MWSVFIFSNVTKIAEGLQRKPNHPACKWIRLVALTQHSFKFSDNDNQKCHKDTTMTIYFVTYRITEWNGLWKLMLTEMMN